MRRFWYRNFRSVSGLQHRLGRRLTPAGQLVAAGLAAAAIVGPNTRITVSYQAFTFLAALLLVAAVLSLRPPARLDVRRRLPRFATAGEPLTYPVLVRNPGPAAVRELALLEELGDPRPSFEEFRDTPEPDEARRNVFDRNVGYPRWAWLLSQNRRATVAERALPPLPPGGEATVRLELTPLRRGRVTFTHTTVARRDPLGLVRALRRAPAPDTLLVLPRRYPLPAVALPGTRRYQPGGIALATSVGDSQEFVALRDYRPGDPLNRIHWRSWARTGKPVVREYQDEFFVRHGLVLDTFVPAATPAFEEAVSVASSFACTIGTQESLLDLLFVGPEAYCVTAGRGVGHVDRMLEILASVRPCRGHDVETLTRLVLQREGGLSGAIFVLLAWDDARRRLVARVRSLGVPTLVLVVTEAGVTLAGADVAGVHHLRVGAIAEGLAEL
ncbi:MAG TPA: DUF58 domain-containing protein [Candidatus Binatia bacterium]|nr:DUF58 domain-containing protein [Candidatus Binatia bacterium]